MVASVNFLINESWVELSQSLIAWTIAKLAAESMLILLCAMQGYLLLVCMCYWRQQQQVLRPPQSSPRQVNSSACTSSSSSPFPIHRPFTAEDAAYSRLQQRAAMSRQFQRQPSTQNWARQSSRASASPSGISATRSTVMMSPVRTQIRQTRYGHSTPPPTVHRPPRIIHGSDPTAIVVAGQRSA